MIVLMMVIIITTGNVLSAILHEQQNSQARHIVLYDFFWKVP